MKLVDTGSLVWGYAYIRGNAYTAFKAEDDGDADGQGT